jgi:antitoxin MazE
MEVKVQKWGNSLAIRIPKVYAREINVDTGSRLTINRLDKRLILEPKQEEKSLKALLEKVTKENIHEEVDTGIRVGNEAW